jgi:PKD repeat protein
MTDRISSLDDGYTTGDLSLFPEALDDKHVLFEATNNSFVFLKQTLTYNGKIIIVEDTSSFPEKGELRIGPLPGEAGEYELVYYDKKTSNTFQKLKRGYAGSKINYWPAVKSCVSNAVVAEHHNAIKDAILNIEVDLGVKDFPDPASLNGILKYQEIRFLAPKPLFRAYPIKGPPPLNVRFQNFTTGHIARFLWDFGDGGTSLEKNPTHTYVADGKYTVKLNVVTTTGAQGIATKSNYITVDKEEAPPFFYVESIDLPYSVKYATENSVDPKEFVFVDQTDGDIVQRNWIFGDGVTYTQQDPDIHEISHIYSLPGSYTVTELIQFSNGRLKKHQLPDPLVVL